MKKLNYVSIIGITVILLSLMFSIIKPEYDIYCNIAAILSFSGVCFYQVYQVYKQGGEWKKYVATLLILILLLSFILFF